MRTNVMRIVIVISALAVASTAAASLVTNGDFSVAGLSGWTVQTTATNSLQDGGGYVRFNGGNTALGSRLSQTISTENAHWYKVNYDLRSHNGSSTVGMSASVFDGVGNSGIADWGFTSLGTSWATKEGYFQAQSNNTTLQFRDYGHNTTSLDSWIDNVVVEEVALGTTFEWNVASQGTVTQSSYYSATSYPGEYGNDGDAFTFMHTENDPGGTWTLTLDQDFDLSRVNMFARYGFNSRVGDTIKLFDASDALIANLPLGDSSLSYSFTGDWKGVRKVVVDEVATVALNFGDLELYTTIFIPVPEPTTILIWSLLAGLGVGLGWRRRRK